MKRALLVCASAAAVWAAACSSGGSTVITPPPPVGFNNNSLSGQYAFSMTGTTFNTQTGLTEPYARVGSFSADGKGGISGGVEDVNIFQSGSNEYEFSNASGYAINTDGRGTLTLVDSTGTLTFDIVMTSASSGYVVDFPSDGQSTASGSFVLQNVNSFNLGGISGNYAFDFSGTDPNGNPESVVGQFLSNGAGLFTTGLADDNDGGTINNGNPGPASISGSYAAPSTSPSDLTSFGRCQFAIGSVTGYLYIVGPNQAKFLEETSGGTLAGDAFLQSGVPTNVSGISGGFAYVMGGAGVSGSGVSGPLARGGTFSANGGNLTKFYVDSNNAGTIVSLGPTTGTSTGTYTIDSAGSGRGTITYTNSTQKNTLQYVFYLYSATQGFIQDQSLAIVSDGSLMAQGTGTISNSSLAGNYSINWSGVSNASGSVAEEDLIGEATLASGSLTGTIALNEFASGFQFPQIGLSGNMGLASDPTTHNTLTINLATNPANNGITAFAYVGNNNNILFMTTQSVRVAAGVLTPQNP